VRALSSKRQRPTQADVAREAGVSQTAVSAVLRGTNSVVIAPETRQRILDAAEKLSYRPNTAAQSLRSSKMLTVACVIPDITNPFYPAFQRGAQDVANQHEYDFVVYNTDGVRARELRCLDAIRKGRVDGVIIAPFQLYTEDLAPLVELGVPIVVFGQLDNEPDAVPFDSIFVDNAAAADALVTHLVEQGHTRIGMITGPTGITRREGRVRGFHAVVTRHGLASIDTLLRGGDFTEVGGYQAMQQLLTLQPRPTAVFAANDLMAIGALNATRDAGLTVPGDLAVAGFDDIPVARMIHPSLTTVAQFPEPIGRRAGELLFDRLLGGVQGQGRREEMPYMVVVRSSA